MTLFNDLKNKLSIANYNRVRIAQATIYLLVITTLIINFNLGLLIVGLVLGYILFTLGVSVSLHKWISHRALDPRNRLVKHLLLLLGTMTTLGTPIEFAAGHRTHHKHSDTEQDPFALTNSWLHNIKLWFLWMETDKINPRVVIDLVKDREIKFYHNNYWKIWSVYPIILFMVDPALVVYLFAIPVVYCLLGMSWVTVIAHSKTLQRWFKGTKPHNENDLSWDSVLFTWLFAGEGYHETHHAYPGERNYGKRNKKFDLSGEIADLLSKRVSSADSHL